MRDVRDLYVKTDTLLSDIEDMLTSIAFLHGKKWTSMLVKRTYFGNWLRDYSQAVDVGSLKGVNAPTIRILVGDIIYDREMKSVVSTNLLKRSGSSHSCPLAMPPRSSR